MRVLLRVGTVLLLGCGSTAAPASSSVPALPGPAPSSPTPTAPREPWGIAWVSTCSEYASHQLFATDHRVLACGMLFDDQGALVAARDTGSILATLGDRSLWRSTGTSTEIAARGETPGGLVWRDEDLDPIGPLALGSTDLVETLARRGPMILGAHDEGALAIDLASGTTTRIDACARAEALGWSREGEVQCVERCDEGACLWTAPGARVVLPDALGSVGWSSRAAVQDAASADWLVLSDSHARWLDDHGAVIETRDVAGATVLDADDDGRILVALPSGVELWRFDGARTSTERVLDAPLRQGVIVGERIVLSDADDVLWLERGALGLATPTPSATPAGFHALERAASMGDDGPPAIFRAAQEVVSRGRASLAAFSAGPGTLARGGRASAVELARAGSDDSAWARLASDRFLVRGEHRSATTWRTEGGRVLRGHTYIGGCERSDVDVLVREGEGGALEVWTVFAGEPEGIDVLFGPTPADARDVPEARSDRYEGDPSIGQL